MNYEEDIKIDETALDIEWLEQPKLFMRYARYAAETQKMLDLAKTNLDLVKAELDKAVRENPDKFGIEKLTETVVLNTILSLPEYKEANEKYINAKFEAEIAKSAVRAFEQRKEALENLVRLHGQQYFAGPKVPRDLTAEREKLQKRVDEQVSKNLNRRIRQ
jgi:hypothetical protein